MFSGVATLNLDSKGRLAIPARHRELLLARSAGRLVLTVSPDRCLLLYPQSDWEPVRDALNQLSGAQAQIRRLVVGHAEEMDMDNAGRILIAPRLRQIAGLEKEIAFVGIGNKFEIWDDGQWSAKNQSVFDLSPADLETQMQGIVL
ncbi:division/cell wall cluster transcriptional repressor MraZ [Jeongeupia naejangsanensis]|uniref:Transcriptional regulator MraZ n=1 Tax=Jeongeupia naejangsanensis TaxID=613195 RepID=A0ABS2BLL3_9NEIS|nr:division/cell wall cluster transcriptional repressor MraZ [Jeongeupia naejangsanensis]MBM3116507.1 division/cell wall cluster transcriptional repressor MraZ [Jeongeupia naejangsanensis]